MMVVIDIIPLWTIEEMDRTVVPSSVRACLDWDRQITRWSLPRCSASHHRADSLRQARDQGPDVHGLCAATTWLWLQSTEDKCWANLKLDIKQEIQAMFDCSTTIVIGNGCLALFWRDC